MIVPLPDEETVSGAFPMSLPPLHVHRVLFLDRR